jgi:hypothetical protein
MDSMVVVVPEVEIHLAPWAVSIKPTEDRSWSDRRVHSNRTTRTLEYRFARIVEVEAAKRAVDAYGRGFCAALVGSSLACNGWIKAQVKAQISGGMPSNYICILASSS